MNHSPPVFSHLPFRTQGSILLARKKKKILDKRLKKLRLDLEKAILKIKIAQSDVYSYNVISVPFFSKQNNSKQALQACLVPVQERIEQLAADNFFCNLNTDPEPAFSVDVKDLTYHFDKHVDLYKLYKIRTMKNKLFDGIILKKSQIGNQLGHLPSEPHGTRENNVYTTFVENKMMAAIENNG